MRLLALALCVGTTACVQPTVTFSHEPINLSLAGTGGGLIGVGTTSDQQQQFPMLLDTASPVTAYSNGSTTTSATRGNLRLFEQQPMIIPRLEIDNIQMFVTPLSGTGLDQSNPVGGVLGGDNLSRFVLGVNYSPTPSISLSDASIPIECEVSEHCGSVLPFSLAGGHQLIDIGDDIYTYPATYVLLDACIEPALDPLEPQLTCSTVPGCGDIDPGCLGPTCAQEMQAILDCQADAQRYVPHGIDVRLAVATGFPGFALSASAFDRLRGTGSALQTIASTPHTFYSPDQPAGSAGITVGLGSLGLAATGAHDANARSALALVGVNSYFGACAELARSRRLRRAPPEHPPPQGSPDETCLRAPGDNDPLLGPLLDACVANTGGTGGVCDDSSDNAYTTAYVELEGPMPVLVLPDTTNLLQSINDDVRPQSATVEGIIGTEMLQRIGTTIDYPNQRYLATCVSADCRMFPRTGHGTDCGAPSVAEPFGGIAQRPIPAMGPVVGCATP